MRENIARGRDKSEQNPERPCEEKGEGQGREEREGELPSKRSILGQETGQDHGVVKLTELYRGQRSWGREVQPNIWLESSG